MANPVEFPDVHKRIMEEHIRARGITYTYKYEGAELLMPLSCQIRRVAQEHLLTILTFLTVFIVCSHVAHHLYFKNYIKRQVLSLIRVYSQHGGVASLTCGIPTKTLFQLLCKDLASAGFFTRFLIRNKLTLESVNEVCYELLWSPKTGVHAYTLHDTNHWWAKNTAVPFSSQDQVNTDPVGSSTQSNGSLTVNVSPAEAASNNISPSFNQQMRTPIGFPDVKTGTTPVLSRRPVNLQLPASLWEYRSPYVRSDPRAATRDHAVCKQPDAAPGFKASHL